MSNYRTFFGLSLANDLKPFINAIDQWIAQQYPKQSIRYTPFHNCHITLQFLGSITSQQLATIEQTTKDLPLYPAELIIPIQKLSYFPPNHQRLVVLLLTLTEALATLVHRLDQLLSPLGFSKEHRPYLPHITLAKKTERTKLCFSECPVAVPDSLSCPELILYESVTSEHGTNYQPLLRW